MTKRINIDIELFIKLYLASLNDAEIAQKMDVKVSRISKLRHKFGLPSVTGKGRKAKRDVLRMELYRRGYSDSQIAQTIGVPESTILSWRKQRGLTVQNIIKPSKYDGILNEFGDQITELYLNGHRDYTIAKILNIPQAAIERWRYRNRLPYALTGSFEDVSPLKSEESLYCDTDFLEKLVGKKLNPKKCVLSLKKKPTNKHEQGDLLF
jgi:transposase